MWRFQWSPNAPGSAGIARHDKLSRPHILAKEKSYVASWCVLQGVKWNFGLKGPELE